MHHVLHIAATGETFGYYQDYADDARKVGRALAEGFVFQGEHMHYRGGTRGKPTADLPPTAFISFIQNHDQSGFALGDRMISYRPLEPLKAVTAVYLLCPQVPMLFMGEEWGAREPFPYFCDFDEDLNEKVRKGRREELSRLPGFDADDLLDPTAKTTFETAKLDWSRLVDPNSSDMLAFYMTLLALRHQRIVPLLKGIGGGGGSFRLDGSVTAVEWTLKDGATFHLVANFSDEPARFPLSPAAERISLGSSADETLSPWAVISSIQSTQHRIQKFQQKVTFMDRDLDQLAKEHGISLTRPSPENVEVPIADSVKRKVLAALGVAVDRGPQKPVRRSLKNHSSEEIIPPSFLPEFLETDRAWGISLQLYELRSERNWGIGDFEDLVEMIGFAATLGADFVGLNPLHAPFLADPDRCSPYEPSNRQMLNSLYIAVDKIAGFESTPELDARLQELRSNDLVDYIQVAKTKLAVLRELWASWRSSSDKLSGARQDFVAFVQDRGEILRRHAVFEALSASMGRQGNGTGWKSWPAEYQQPESAEVAAFTAEHEETIDFHMWLQWHCHQQLTRAADAAQDAGLRVGLYLDLAVGEAIDGSATWSEPGAYISDATVGSPPDPFAPNGQDWHLAAFHPAAIASGGNAPFRRMVTAAMRYASAIRIDHAAALRRLFLVPLESSPDEGAYVD